MKWLQKALLILLIIGLIPLSYQPIVHAENVVVIHFFYEQTCTNCQKMSDYLDEITVQYGSSVVVNYYEILFDDDALALYSSVKEAFGVETDARVTTPFTVIGGVYLPGFNAR